MIKFVDLFAGMGGTRLGLERSARNLNIDVKCVFTSEIKPYALKTYNRFFKENNGIVDIVNIDSKDIPDFDILLGGFPCQAFSDAGKRRGFEDTRGTLFFEIARILKDKKPKAFILENVEGLITHDKGKTLSVILSTLEQLKYNVSYKVLDSKYFSTAQSRKRIYIVGTINNKISIDFKKEKPIYFKDIQENNLPVINNDLTNKILKHYKPEELYGKALKDKRGGEKNIHSWDIALKGEVSIEQKILLDKMVTERRKKIWSEIIGIDWMDGMPLTAEQIATFYTHKNLTRELNDLCKKGYLKLEHPKKKEGLSRIPDISKPKGYNIVAGKLSYGFSMFLDPNNITPTLVATDLDKIGVVDNGGIRKLSLVEGLRLFGYPDNYPLQEVKEKEAYDLLGNTICVNIIKKIADNILPTI